MSGVCVFLCGRCWAWPAGGRMTGSVGLLLDSAPEVRNTARTVV